MKFSTQNLLSIRDWQTHAEVYQNAVTECRLADELGFDVVWLAEHHFSQYGICPSLAPLAGAIAATTRRVRIGTAVVIAPFEHPLRIAEEWAEIDILSGGRLSMTEEKAIDQAAIAGDAEEVADKIRMHREALEVTHFMGAFSRGGLAHDKVIRSMRLFAEKVIPKVR